MKIFFKNLFCFLLLLAAAVVVNAQHINQWIEYDKTYYKFYVEEDGLVRIPYNTLQTLGLPLIGSHFKLITDGKEIPIYVSTEGEFLSTDYIEFYGERNNGAFDTQLYESPTWQVQKEWSLFTDKAAYYLVSDDDANHIHYNTINNNLANAPQVLTHFEHKVSSSFPNIYTNGLAPRIVGGVYNHFADFNENEGYSSEFIGGGSNKDFTIASPSAYSAAGNAKIEFKILGLNDDVYAIPDHHVIGRFNNNIVVDTCYEGHESINRTKLISSPILQDINVFNIESVGDKFSIQSSVLDNGLAVDKNSLAYIELTYNRTFDFDGERDFSFGINNEESYIELIDFVGGPSPIMYDITNRMRIEPIIEGTTLKVHLPEPNFAGNKRELFIANTTSIFSVDTIDQLIPTTFTDFAETDGDYILLYNQKLAQPLDGENQVIRYKNYRESVEGGGYKVVLVDVEELYDQFAFGIQQHPMSINSFVNYTKAMYNVGIWNVEPEFLHLVGKGIVYNSAKTNAAAFSNNLVPTYGSGGDIMLAVNDVHTSYIPQLAVGRTSARTAQELKNYLDKVIEHEAISYNIPCDPVELERLKSVVHIAGGESGTEAVSFKANLDEYKAKIEDDKICANVIAEFVKETSGIVDIEQLHPYINDGLMLITYVGHSGGTIWEFDIKQASEYTNYGKYPFILSNSCFVGDVFQVDVPGSEIMSIDWTITPNLGAIGFLATVQFGYPNFLHTYTNRLHDLIAKDNYLTPIGKSTQQTINDIFIQNDSSAEGVGRKITCQEFTLLCDPAIKIGRFDRPILYFGENDITIDPPIIDTSVDSFQVNIALKNYGACNNDSAKFVIERTYPDGSIEMVVNQTFDVPGYQDTLSFWVQTEPLDGLGTNNLKMYIDEDTDFSATSCFDDNEIIKDIFIVPNSATPVSPCNYAIVGNTPTLRASTSLTSWELSSSYIVQLDTTGIYNSPFLQSETVTGIGGVVEWKPADELFIDGVEYFWRVGQVPPEGGLPVSWQTSSFIYMADEAGGWNQSDYYQFAENRFNGLRVDPLAQEFDYDTTLNYIRCKNSTDFNFTNLLLNNTTSLAESSCLYGCGGGIMVAAFKPKNIIEPITSIKSNDLSGCDGEGQWGNVFCSGGTLTQEAFAFYTGDADKIQQFNSFLNSIPNGYYILAYGIRDHRMEASSNMATEMQPILNFFENELGIEGLDNVEKNFPFIMLGKKGSPNYARKTEVYAETLNQPLDVTMIVEGKSNFGSMSSRIVGPSNKWDKLVWDGRSLDNIDNRDEYAVEIYLRDQQGQTTLYDVASATNNEFTKDLSSVDANQYPFIELVYDTRDTFNYSAPQLDYWRIYHDKYVELALDPASQLQFDSDTLFEGAYGNLSLALGNVMPFASDSVAVQYTVTDLSGNQVTSDVLVNYPPIDGGTTFNLTYDVPTDGLSEDSYLFVQVNPNKEQNEKFSFNNQILIPFYVLSDELNPIVDVTFDGDHILDGDIVSAKPLIDVQLKDENTYLALNDTSLMAIGLVYPNGDVRTINYNDLDVEYTLANPTDAQEKNNVFNVKINPEFLEDGMYQLQINGKDVSDNKTGSVDYSISFQVITEATISNVVNYPNPFTTSTQFVFNLTGSDVPDNLRIQIMTVTGKVVKEITRSELGNLRIGRNITEYAWDGKDEYGNELANGVYFYRVTASSEGEDYNYFTQDAENGNISSTSNLDKAYSDGKIGSRYKNFKIGKMYKLK